MLFNNEELGALTLIPKGKRRKGSSICSSEFHPPRSATYECYLLDYHVGSFCLACAKEWASVWKARGCERTEQAV